MDFWDIVKVVAVFAFFALMIGFMIWAFASQLMEVLNFSAGFHDLQLAYLISQKDIESLSKEEWKKTRRMEYAEMKAFLQERFPNSVPAIGKCECGTAPKTKSCECD